MRQYQEIWIALKKFKRVKLAVPPALHRRTTKAVMKERWKDTEYTFLLASQNKRFKIQYSSNQALLELWLVEFEFYDMDSVR